MHSLGPALDQSPDLFLVIGHIQVTPFDGTTPGAFRSAYRVGLLYVSKLIGGRQSFRLVLRVSLPHMRATLSPAAQARERPLSLLADAPIGIGAKG